MSSSENSVSNRSPKGCAYNGHCGRGKWSPMNIFVMVMGFVLFWPLGLVVLFWILSGRNVRDLPGATKNAWNRLTGREGSNHYSGSDNVVFNEYQQTQYDRIREIKEEISGRAERFAEYRSNAKRKADEAEFKAFMSNSPLRETS